METLDRISDRDVGLLSLDAAAHITRLLHLIQPHSDVLDRRFRARLSRLGFDPAQRDTLANITPGAAANGANGVRTFFDGIEESGRTLAKLDVTPMRVSEALREYDRLVQPVTARAEDAESLARARQQFQFCVLLSLNNAYLQVREAEAKAFYRLSQIEFEAADIDTLLGHFLDAMLECSGAVAGEIFFLDSRAHQWVLRASSPPVLNTGMRLHAPGSIVRELAKPLHIDRQGAARRLLIDPEWRWRFTSCWSIPLLRGGELCGAVQLGFAQRTAWLPRELELLQIVGKRCLAASERAELIERLRQREYELQDFVRRMFQVEELERKRLSRELHDDAGQSLVVVRLQLDMIESALAEDSEARKQLIEARQLAEKTIDDVRRLIKDLSPAVMEKLGISAAIRQLIADFRKSFPGHVRSRIGRLPESDPGFEVVIYRLLQAWLSNVARHSQATNVNISVNTADTVLRVQVEDDGVGFDVEAALNRRESFGLLGIRERVTVLGGRCEISSSQVADQRKRRPVKPGTVILIEIPVPGQKKNL